MSAGVHTRRHALFVCVTALLTLVVCAALGAAAMLAPAPPAAVPVVVLVCLAGPMLALWELPAALSVLRHGIWGDARELARMRRGLERLPEVEHPLGF